MHQTMRTLLLPILLIIGCGCSQQTKQPIKETPKHFVSEYIPIKENTTLYYQGIGNEYASYQVTFDYTNNNKVQLRFNNGGTSYVEVWKIESGALLASRFAMEMYHRENLIDSAPLSSTILLQEPLLVGMSWNNDNNKSTITAIDFPININDNRYDTIEVTTQIGNGSYKQYYAKGLGMIKREDDGISSTLDKIQEHTALIQSIDFYFPSDDGIKVQSKEVSFLTNASTIDVLETAYLDVIGKNMPTSIQYNDSHINQLELEEDMVYLDFKKNVLFDTNVGASMEQRILQAIANTFGGYYGVDKVVITVDGQPYESGDIAMRPGEYFVVDFQEVNRIP